MRNRKRRGTRTAVCVLILVAGIAGCGGGKAAHTAGAVVNPPRTPSPHDPPVKFGPSGVALPLPAETTGADQATPPPVALNATTAYVAGAADLTATDVTSGRTLWSAAPTGGTPTGQTSGTIPLLVRSSGTLTVLAVFSLTVPGTGTTPSHPTATVLAVNAATGVTTWTAQIDTTTDAANGVPTAHLVGTDAHTAVISTGDTSYGLSLDTRQPTWTKHGFAAAVVAGDDLVGADPADPTASQQVTAVRLGDGSPLWHADQSSYQVAIQSAGPHMIAVTGQNYSTGDRYFSLIGTSAGGVILTQAADRYAAITCTYDQAETTVCAQNTGGTARADGYDAATGRHLWSLPDTTTNRVAPTVTTTWHGAVYGTTSNGPLVLDARTGADRSDSPVLAPILLNAYTAIAVTPADGRVTAYPTE